MSFYHNSDFGGKDGLFGVSDLTSDEEPDWLGSGDIGRELHLNNEKKRKKNPGRVKKRRVSRKGRKTSKRGRRKGRR